MKVHRGIRAAALLGVMAMVTIGCSSAAKDEGGGSKGSTPAGDLQLDKPLSIALMFERQGESEFAIDDFADGSQLAVETINAAGGVGGHPIEVERFPAPPVDVQGLTTQFLRAAETEPDLMIGFPGNSVEGITRQIDSTGIPIIGNVVSQNIRLGASSGSEWLFHLASTDASAASAAAEYAIEELGAKEIGVLHTNESYGETGAEVATAKVEELGAEVLATRSFAPDATQLTEPVLAVKDVDAVINWSFPQQLVAQLDEFEQNGFDIPTIAGTPASITVDNQLATGAAIKGLYGVLNCNPTGDDRPSVQKFVEAYEAMTGRPPSVLAALAYDAVFVAKAAVEAAGSVDRAEVRDALESVSFTDGVCAPDYRSDGAHVLSHTQVVVSYATGAPVTESTYEIDDEDRVSE